MGCDIHLYREKLVNGRWVTADEWANEYGDGADVPFDKRFTDRNYNLFSILAGVRTRETPPCQFSPRGLPIQPSAEVLAAHEAWGCDGHSTSHLYLNELQELRALMTTQTIKITGMKNRIELVELRKSIESAEPDWGLLYPYCQGTNDPNQERFSIDVPCTFIVGNGLDKIIKSLEEIGGESQRIVFWFDN